MIFSYMYIVEYFNIFVVKCFYLFFLFYKINVWEKMFYKDKILCFL